MPSTIFFFNKAIEVLDAWAIVRSNFFLTIQIPGVSEYTEKRVGYILSTVSVGTGAAIYIATSQYFLEIFHTHYKAFTSVLR